MRTLLVGMIALAGTAFAQDPVEVGQNAPDFTVTGIDGKEFQLSDKLKDKKKNVVLLFSRANW